MNFSENEAIESLEEGKEKLREEFIKISLSFEILEKGEEQNKEELAYFRNIQEKLRIIREKIKILKNS